MDKMAGKSKELMGKATGNKKMEIKGKSQQAMAQIKDKTDEALHDLGYKNHR